MAVHSLTKLLYGNLFHRHLFTYSFTFPRYLYIYLLHLKYFLSILSYTL